MKFKTLEGSEKVRFLQEEEPSWTLFEEMFLPENPCDGRHCAVHRPFSHVWTNSVKGTGKYFTTRVRCQGPGCQICEALHD